MRFTSAAASNASLAVLLVAVLSLAPACEKKAAPAAQPIAQPNFEIPSEGSAAAVAKPTKAQMDKVESVYQECIELVAQADRFRQEGIAIQKEQGRDAANSKLAKAKGLYRRASQMMEEEIEPELGAPFNAEQVDKYLRTYTREMGKWTKKAASMGKVNQR